MRKSLIAVVIAGLAVTAVVSPAQARGRGFGVGLGVGLIVGGIIASQHHHHHHQKPRYVRPAQPYPQATRPQQPVAPVVRTADDQGRFYDAASKTWFDGRSQCFTGATGWSFKAGSWFYGSARWAEKDGSWQAANGAVPTAVECASVPSIAARMPKQPADKTAVVVPSVEDHTAATPPPAADEGTVAINAVEGAAHAGIGGGGRSN